MIEYENRTAPFPVKSLAVDIENVFLLERAIASLLDLNGTLDDAAAVNFTEFRGILNQSEDAVIDLADVVRRSINQLAGVEVTEDTIVVIESVGYFSKIGALLESVPKRVLANYLVMRHVLDLSGATTETMRRLKGGNMLRNSCLGSAYSRI